MTEASVPVIRAARADDSPELTKVMLQASAYQGEYAPMLQDYVVTPEQIDTDIFVVAEQSGRVVGFYSLTDRSGPELDLMFVGDSLQGNGFGRSLFDHVIRTARSQGWEEIKIISHPPSEGFYRRMGAVRIGTEPPRGRVSWERPILTLALGTPDCLAPGEDRPDRNPDRGIDRQ